MRSVPDLAYRRLYSLDVIRDAKEDKFDFDAGSPRRIDQVGNENPTSTRIQYQAYLLEFETRSHHCKDRK
jgi:hypothetical protein